MERSEAPRRSMAAGNDEFLGGLFRAHQRELTQYVARTFGAGPPEPEEVVQAAFARFAALEHPEAVGNPRAYLYTTSRNIVLDTRRREATRDASAHETMIAQTGDAPANSDSERVLIAKQELAIIEATVRTMDVRRQEVLVMHAIHGLSYSEIGRRLGLSETRIRQLFASAIAECEAATADDLRDKASEP